jgi:hypothetical protein
MAMDNLSGRRFYKAVLRWIYILTLYAVSYIMIAGFPPFIKPPFGSLLSAVALYPDSVLLEEWIIFCINYAKNCVFMSLSLVIIWNLLYAPFALGRKSARSAIGLSVLFTVGHTALMGYYISYVLAQNPFIWLWFSAEPAGSQMRLALPCATVIPFFISIWFLCPYRIDYALPGALWFKMKLRLRVTFKYINYRGPS